MTEEQIKPTAENPAAVTDQAPSDAPSPAPTVDAVQGSSTVVAESEGTSNVDSVSDVAVSEARETNTSDEPNEVSEVSMDASAEGSQTETAETGPKHVEMNIDSLTEAAGEDFRDPTLDAGANSVSESAYASVDGFDDDITMEEVLAASDEQLQRKPIHRGMMITGNIIMLAQSGIIVDVGAKIEGVIPYNQLFDQEITQDEAAQYFKPGDEIQVFVVRSDIPNNTIILSKKRADQERAWNLLQHIFDEKKPVEVEIVERVRGGLVANLGVRAFLPASQVDVRRVNELDPYVGQRMKVRIIELNRKRNRIIISRRSIIEEEIAERKAETLQKLEPGLVMDGDVVEITDFGVFVNLGGVDGLVHRSEIGFQRFNHPKDVLNLGDIVKVEVLDMDLERERINLSMKKLLIDPWENVLSTYHISQRVSGKVSNLTQFGAFVELEPGLEGLIHVSEMSWTKKVRHPKEVVKLGDEVEAMILKIDLNDKRISLGLRQTQPDPWSSLPDRFPPGTEVSGTITGLTEFGVFMEIEEGIEGLIHVSELDHERIDRIEDHFKKGDEIQAVILNIDPVEQRASLSRKRALPYQPPAMEERDFGGYSQQGGGDRRGGSGASSGRSKGRRGGRRSQGIDYDYSYAMQDSSSKATTKLGDVYADLFAQFGLAEGTAEEPAPADTAPKAEAPAAPAEPEASAPEPVETASEAPAEAPVEAPAEPETTASAEESEDPANAIDAVEAVALLTSAFREKRPASLADTTIIDGADTAGGEDNASTNTDDDLK